MLAYFYCFNLFVWKGHTLYVVGSFFFSKTKEKHFRFQKYPDTCNRGLNVLSRTVDSNVGGNCVGSPTSTSLDTIYWRGMSKSSSVVWHACQWDIYNSHFQEIITRTCLDFRRSLGQLREETRPAVCSREEHVFVFPEHRLVFEPTPNPLGKDTPET